MNGTVWGSYPTRHVLDIYDLKIMPLLCQTLLRKYCFEQWMDIRWCIMDLAQHCTLNTYLFCYIMHIFIYLSDCMWLLLCLKALRHVMMAWKLCWSRPFTAHESCFVQLLFRASQLADIRMPISKTTAHNFTVLLPVSVAGLTNQCDWPHVIWIWPLHSHVWP